MPSRLSILLSACLLPLITLQTADADLRIDGDRLTVSTSNIRLVFQGGDIISITNRLTGDAVAYGLHRPPPLSGVLTEDGRSISLRSDGWRRGHENAETREAAQTVLRDLTHTVWMNVILDKDTEDVTIGTWSESRTQGVMGLGLAVRNLDLSVGRLIVPTDTGFEYSLKSPQKEFRLVYPTDWRAQMLVWQCPEGGIVVYSRDTDGICKGIRLTRSDKYADVLLETHADGPWSSQTSVPYLEWRINAYKGDWQVPASGYRMLMAALRERTSPPDVRLWAGQISRVIETPPNANDQWLAELVSKSAPARTLLLIKSWATSGPPDYRMTDEAATLIGKAHERGFYVMVPIYVQHARSDWAAARNMQRARLQRAQDVGPPNTLCMNPGSEAWRRALIAALRDTFGGARPDALLLQDAHVAVVDADRATRVNGTRGLPRLLDELQAAFPDMVLGAEGLNEIILPHIRFCRQPRPGVGTNHPITDFLFGRSVIWFQEQSAVPADSAERKN